MNTTVIPKWTRPSKMGSMDARFIPFLISGNVSTRRPFNRRERAFSETIPNLHLFCDMEWITDVRPWKSNWSASQSFLTLGLKLKEIAFGAVV